MLQLWASKIYEVLSVLPDHIHMMKLTMDALQVYHTYSDEGNQTT